MTTTLTNPDQAGTALTQHQYGALLPAMTDDEYAELRADIATHGQQLPLIIFQGQVLDGWHRYRVLSDVGIEPRCEDFTGDELGALHYVVSANLRRRHLSASQRAALAVEFLPLLEKHGRERMAKAGSKASPGRPAEKGPAILPDLSLASESRQQAAALTGTSARYVSEAKRIAEQAPDVLKAVKAGALDLPLAKRVAALPAKARPDVLTQVVAATAKGTRAGRHEAELAVTRASGQPRLAVVPAPLGTLGSFPVILADPPWRYTPAEVTRRVENHYPTMSLDDIKALDVPAADDAVLFLWANSALLPEAIDVMGAWGFQYKTCAIWTKDKIGMGYYFRQQHELLLLGTRGQLPAPEPANRPSSLIAAPRLGHSAKPVEAYEAIEQMYPSHRKVELFARQPRTGWVAWGNETTAAL